MCIDKQMSPDRQYQIDSSGVGHCWRYITTDHPMYVEVDTWAREADPRRGEKYTASNGQTFRRWWVR